MKFCNWTVATEKEKYRINLDKPIYIGTNISDLSKLLMQDFDYIYIYIYIKYKYGNKVEMLLTDTVSLMYKVEAEKV